MGSETLPSACYILSDESSIPFYSTSNGYNNWNYNQNNIWPEHRNFRQNKNQNNSQKQQTIEPMDVDPSLQIQNKPSNNWQANNNQKADNIILIFKIIIVQAIIVKTKRGSKIKLKKETGRNC